MPPTIRLATPDDAEQVRAIYAPYCETPISFELEPPTVEEMRGRMAKVLGRYPWLVCEQGGEVLGYVYATQHRERAAYRWSVDTTVYVRQGRQRRGPGAGVLHGAVGPAPPARLRQTPPRPDPPQPAPRRPPPGAPVHTPPP